MKNTPTAKTATAETPAERIAAAARVAAYAFCKAHSIETCGNPRLDLFTPAFNAAYRKEHEKLLAAFIETESAR